MENVIKKIVLDLGKKEITLTPEQAKKLKEALDEMFGKEVVREIHHDHYTYPWGYWLWDSTKVTYGNPEIHGTTFQTSYDSNSSAMTLKVA